MQSSFAPIQIGLQDLVLFFGSGKLKLDQHHLVRDFIQVMFQAFYLLFQHGFIWTGCK